MEKQILKIKVSLTSFGGKRSKTGSFVTKGTES